MRRQRVDCVEMVPAIADLLARHLSTATHGHRLDAMRLFAVGSDSWRMADLHRLTGILSPRARLVSSYGVTEAAIDSSFYDPGTAVVSPRRQGDGASDRPVPIGRPFAGTRLHVLDRCLEPFGIGVAGELCLGGGSLARGYAECPAATAERFVPDPFAAEPGGRLYRTGDRVRHLGGGELDFLGRVDHQIKVRGMRIEPGEVEAALRRHPAIRDAVAVCQRDAGGEGVVAAYMILLPGASEVTPADLRAFLGRWLPEPMIPSVFEIRAALPLNANGKVDRAALSRATPGRATPGQAPKASRFEPPATATERALAEIWARILGVGRVGRTADFFLLGGHSLRAVRLMVEVERRFGVSLALASLFRRPTLAQLARRIDAPGAEEPALSDQVLVEIARGDDSVAPLRGDGKPPFYCAHPVGGHVLCYADLARQLVGEYPFFGLQSPPGPPSNGHAGDLGAMAQRYLEAIRAQRPAGPYFLGGWSMGGVLAFEIARRLRSAGARVGALVLIDCAAPGSPSAAEVDRVSSLEGFAQDLGIEGNGGPPLSELPAAQALARLLEAGRRQGLLGDDVDAAQLGRLYRRFESNDLAMKRFRPRPYGGPLTLLRSAEWRGQDPTLGWSELAGSVDVRLVAGDHYSMVREPHVRQLAISLKAELARGMS